MDKKFYFYHLKNEGLTKLLKIKFNCKIAIYSNSGEIYSEFVIKSNGYNVIGENINQFEIYRDTTNNIYYLCTNGHSDIQYFNVGVNLTNDGGVICEYEDNFDVTGLTKLNPLNINGAVTNRKLQYTPTVEANTTTEYVCTTPYRQNMAQSFLVLFSGRLNSGVGCNALLFFHRITTSTSSDSPVFTMETIYADNTLSQFNITPTKTGFTFNNASQNYRYSITEISNNTVENLL